MLGGGTAHAASSSTRRSPREKKPRGRSKAAGFSWRTKGANEAEARPAASLTTDGWGSEEGHQDEDRRKELRDPPHGRGHRVPRRRVCTDEERQGHEESAHRGQEEGCHC